MHIGDLLFHQITEHHFFQGLESKYRIDPKRLIGFFGLDKDISYKSEIETYYYWPEPKIYSYVKKYHPDKYFSPYIKPDYPNIILPEPNYDSNTYMLTNYNKNIIVEFDNHLIVYKNDYGTIPYKAKYDSLTYNIIFNGEENNIICECDYYAIGIYHFEKHQAIRPTENEKKFRL